MLNAKKLKSKLSRAKIEGLVGVIEVLINTPPVSDDDKLHYAVLAEIHQILSIKLCKGQIDYSINFSQAQAIALRILYVNYFTDQKTSHIGNVLHKLSNEVHQLYQL